MSAHLRAQLMRFARISLLAFLAALPATGGRLSWSSLFALGAGAVETAVREVLPVKPIPSVEAVLADPEKPVAPPPAKG